MNDFKAAYETGIRAFTATRASKRLYRQVDADDWRHGGCAALAKALARLLPGELISLGDRPEQLAHHVLLRYGNLYLDSAGAHTHDEIVAEYRRVSGQKIVLAPMTPETTLPLWFDDQFIDEISNALRPHLRGTLALITAQEQRSNHG